jgi:hypothetical protein
MGDCTCGMGFGTDDDHRISCPASVESVVGGLFNENIRLRKLLRSIGDLPRRSLEGNRALYGSTMKNAVTGELSELYVNYKDVQKLLERV